jgi:signal transduction histidine kinase/Tfp pilus assembly protein PilF
MPMKKLIIILFLLVQYLSFAQQKNSVVDSLEQRLKETKNQQWIETATELSSKLVLDDVDRSKSLIEDAIKFAIKLNYPQGLGNAYQVKGIISYNENKPLAGITYYQKAFELFTKLNNKKEIATSLLGVAEGLARTHNNEAAKDTLIYTLKHYRDSISPDIKSIIFHTLSNTYATQGNNDTAILYIDSSISLEKEHNLQDRLTSSYNVLGVIYFKKCDNTKSLHYYDLSEKNAIKTKDTLHISFAMHNKALLYLDWGVYDEALKLFLSSKQLLEKAGYESDLVGTISSIASVYHEIHDIEKARHYYEQALALAIKYNDNETKSVILHNMGELMYFEKKYDSSMYLLNQSLRYEEQEGNTLGIAQSKSMLATVYVAKNNYKIAFSFFNEAEKVFKKYGSKNDLANLYIELAKAHVKLQNDSLSISYFEKGIHLAKEINAINLMLKAYKDASANFERINECQKALSYFKEYKSINDSLYNVNSTGRIAYMSTKLENQEREQELEKLENNQKVYQLESKNRNIFMISALSILILILGFFIWLFIMNKKSKKKLTDQYNVLLESEQKIKALLDASFDSTLLVDDKGMILAANNNDLNGFFKNTDSLINKELFQLFNATNENVLKKFIHLVLSTKEPREIQIHEDNGVILNIKISPVIDTHRGSSSLAIYTKDITQIEKDKDERTKMEHQLVQTQKMETFGTLAGGIAHDFNNYLATIKGYITMLLEDVDKESHIHRYLTRIEKAVVLAQGTVKKLLAFSRKNEIVFNKTPIHELISDSIDMVKGSKPKNINLKIGDIPQNMEILADKNQLTQVFINICNNAFHAIGEKKSGEVNIQLETTNSHPEFSRKEVIIISINDNGMGIEQETMKRIFEPFYTTKDVGKGTGLGLSMVAGIIKQHNGKIEVSSEFGKGSTFSVILPLI